MPRRLPPLRSLEAFVAIVKLGSAKAAAADLALSPSALSRRVTALEDFTGRRLFRRQHQSMELTEEGRMFFEAVAPALDELAERIGRQMTDGKNMRLRLGVMPLFGSQRLVPRLPELKRIYPPLHIDIDTAPHPELKLGDTLDAAIMLTAEPDPALHAVRLDQNRMHAIASRELAEALGPTPDPNLLRRQTFLLHSDMPKSLDRWCDAVGIEKVGEQAIDHFDSGSMMLEAAAQGLGIAIMHNDHMTRSHDERLARLYDVEVESPYSYWFLCRPRELQNRAVRIFHDWVLKAGL